MRLKNLSVFAVVCLVVMLLAGESFACGKLKAKRQGSCGGSAPQALFAPAPAFALPPRAQAAPRPTLVLPAGGNSCPGGRCPLLVK